jgi:hypothetical protein
MIAPGLHLVGPNIATKFQLEHKLCFAYHPENFNDADGDGYDDNQDDYIYASTMTPGRGWYASQLQLALSQNGTVVCRKPLMVRHH